jgi:polysaccharide biosynthesis/export protein
VKRLLWILFALSACPGSLPAYDYAREPDPRKEELVLGVGDVLQINVWGQENKELNTEAKIRPDGTITMPLVGDLRAAGQTPTVLKDKIKAELAKFLKVGAGTEITVAVKAWNSYRFTISGEVTKPGVFTSDQYVRVSQAIAMAGGLTRFAKRNDMRLFRFDPATKHTKHIPLDYDQLASGKRPDMDIFVLPGDEIYSP